MASRVYGKFFRISQWIVRKIYPAYNVLIHEQIKDPVVYVSHHQNLFNPFIIYLWFPKDLRTWILHVFLDRKACFRQYVDYTFTKRMGMNRTIAKICAYPLSFFIAHLLKSGKGIPVYRGSKKIFNTFRLTVEALKRGESVVIYPTVDYTDTSNETKDMHEGYLFIEKYYFRETAQHVRFVPLYVSKNKRLIISGEPVTFHDDEDFSIGQKRIGEHMRNQLHELAKKCGDLE
ncbi:glycerol acyltransferase [Ureibacillus sp. FSL K6-8385]|uniref:Glycerol acyltransferase n=2 Tax=Bacillati TaxID=1783272 RepID=A0A540V0V0_9BACL|nr:glycerol acyltransferase [Ureibacillus terrenus]MED3662196.1 glycerol acyltransferase [Ureibacillus terrenus]MED3765148.1 glycerol acyltransferase [Ureibacillus terrenus]TQE90358.1 glycerol acyltransferase [Ureibacillus terrenus]